MSYRGVSRQLEKGLPLALLLALLMAACAEQIVGPSTLSTQTHPFERTGPSPYEPPSEIEDFGITLEPAPIPSAITQEEAIKVASNQTALLDVAKGVYAAYGLFTSTVFLTGESEADLSPRWVKVPAWIVTFDRVPLSIYGPAPDANVSVTPIPRPTFIGEMDVVIDATTGAYMISFSF